MMSPDLNRVEGPNLVLRLIQTEDSDYLHGLRTNPSYNQHLSEVRGTAEDQRRWIEAYKSREAEGRELYYVIERRDGVRCGVVRLYDIGRESFTWGSWILDHNKTRRAALESAWLVYLIAFDRLGLSRSAFEVVKDNAKALSFHRQFGATETSSDHVNVYFVYSRSTYESAREHFLGILTRVADSARP